MQRRPLVVVLLASVVVTGAVAVAMAMRPGPRPPVATATDEPATQAVVSPHPVAEPPGQQAGRYQDDNWGFDHPQAWQFIAHRYVAMSHFSVIGYVTSQDLDVAALCGRTSQSSSQCRFGDFGLEPGNVALMLSHWGFPSGDPVGHFTNPASGDPIEVGGMPAVVERRAIRADLIQLTWQIARPGILSNWIQIDAELRGPDIETLEAAARAAVDSLTFDPPPPILRAADGPDAADAALLKLKSGDDAQAYVCFPPAGQAFTGTVSRLPYTAHRSPIEVTCRTTIAPTAIGLWRMELEVTWTPTEKDPEGAHTYVQWITANGELAGAEG